MLRYLAVAALLVFALVVIPTAAGGEVHYTLSYDDRVKWLVHEHYAEGFLATVEWTGKSGWIRVFAQDLELGNGVNTYASASASWIFKLTAPPNHAFSNASWTAYFHVNKGSDPGSKVILKFERSGIECFQPPATVFTIKVSASLKAISYDNPFNGGGRAWAEVKLDRVEVTAFLVPLTGGSGGNNSSSGGEEDNSGDEGGSDSGGEVKNYLVKIKVYPEGAGTTTPPPGKYYPSAGSRMVVTATPNEGWWFSHWLLNGKIAKEKPRISFLVDKNITLIACFGQYSPGISLADVLRRESISRAMPGEAVFIKVHLEMPHWEAGKRVIVRGYVDPEAALWWNGSSYVEQLGVVTKTAVVQSDGTLEVVLGTPTEHWKIKPSLSCGSTHEVVVYVNETKYKGLFKVDAPTISFMPEKYGEQGITGQFMLRWLSDNSSITDRAGFFTIEIPSLQLSAVLNSSTGEVPVFISYDVLEATFGSLGEAHPTEFKALLTAPSMPSPSASCIIQYQPVGAILLEQQLNGATVFTCLWPSLKPLPQAEVEAYWDSHLVGLSLSDNEGYTHVNWHPSIEEAAVMKIFKVLKVRIYPPKAANILYDPHHYGDLIVAIIP